MNVNLKIDNDAELRAYIKDLIKGQFSSLVRDEIKVLVQELVIKKITKETIDNIIHDNIKKILEQSVNNFVRETKMNDIVNKVADSLCGFLKKKVLKNNQVTLCKELLDSISDQLIKSKELKIDMGELYSVLADKTINSKRNE